MKKNAAQQLELYRQLTKSQNLAEVQITYRTKVKPAEREQITSSRDTYEILQRIYINEKIEHVEYFYIMLLNRANKVLGWVKISEGGICSTTADIRVIMQSALLSNATGIILSHNHPSGNAAPSHQDIQLTQRIKEGATILDISLLDHVIITTDRYYSFADEGRI